MEQIVLSHPGGQVIRLPQVAGPKAPPNTLLASLKRKILIGEEIFIWANAFRNIIDLKDVLTLVSFFINQNSFPCKILNVANIHSYSVDQIVEVMSNLLNKQATITRLDKGIFYNIDVSDIICILDSTSINFNDNYLEKVIQLYYV
jgi:nucleoside-diphosphate-sugar epimerase